MHYGIQYASDFRDHVPSAEELRELRQPAGMGAAASLLPIALVLWRMTRSKPSRREQIMHDHDWQQRLVALKERWSPKRLELEKTSISRH
jgi:hypothetical protein